MPTSLARHSGGRDHNDRGEEEGSIGKGGRAGVQIKTGNKTDGRTMRLESKGNKV